MRNSSTPHIELKGTQVELTPPEKEYLATIGPITVCPDPDWYPFEHIDSTGRFVGIAADLLELIFGRLGLSYQLMAAQDWTEALALSRAGKAHILPFLNQTPQRDDWLVFTEPIFVDPNVLITKDTHPFISNPANLTCSSMVLPHGTAMEEFIRRDYPNLEVRTVSSEDEAFYAVAANQADLTMRSLMIAASIIRRENYRNLKISGQVPDCTNYLRMGVLKSNPLLRDILDRSIATISPQNQAEIVHRYVEVSPGKQDAWAESLESFVTFLSSSAWYWSYRLQKMNDERRILLDNIESHVWYLRDSHTYGAVNQAHARFFGLLPTDLEYKKIETLFDPQEAQEFITNNRQAFAGKEPLRSEQGVTDGQGRRRILAITQTPVTDRQGGVDYVVCSATDITEQKQAMAEIEYLSFHDVLTGLYNRRFYEVELRRLDVPRNLPFSLAMIDVNGLKLTNDAFGHAAGDNLIKKVAEILKQTCRADDIVARIGGDEFAILLPKTDREQVRLHATRILQAMAAEEVAGLPLSVSCGWATKSDPTTDMDDVFKQAEDLMYSDKVSERSSYRYQTIRLIMQTLHTKSPREQQHSERVSRLCGRIGLALGLNQGEINELITAGELHDIGKISVSENILDKPLPLSDSEWLEMKKHPEAGYSILSSANDYGPLAESVLSHHERWDGAGYPSGLKEDEIPLAARIIAIAGAYDAMISKSPYHKGLSHADAMEEIKAGAGTQFDPAIAAVFLDVMARRDHQLFAE